MQPTSTSALRDGRCFCACALLYILVFVFALSVYLGMWQCSTCDRNLIFYFLLRGGGVLEDRSQMLFFLFFVFCLFVLVCICGGFSVLYLFMSGMRHKRFLCRILSVKELNLEKQSHCKPTHRKPVYLSSMYRRHAEETWDHNALSQCCTGAAHECKTVCICIHVCVCAWIHV